MPTSYRIVYPDPVLLGSDLFAMQDYLGQMLDACPDLGKGSKKRAFAAKLHEKLATSPCVLTAAEYEYLRRVIEQGAVSPALGRKVIDFDRAVIEAEKIEEPKA